MRRVRLALLFAILGLLTISSGGCLWLAVPELAYEGYKAEEKPGNQSAQKSSKTQTNPASSAQQTNTATDTSIE